MLNQKWFIRQIPRLSRRVVHLYDSLLRPATWFGLLFLTTTLKSVYLTPTWVTEVSVTCVDTVPSILKSSHPFEIRFRSYFRKGTGPSWYFAPSLDSMFPVLGKQNIEFSSVGEYIRFHFLTHHNWEVGPTRLNAFLLTSGTSFSPN